MKNRNILENFESEIEETEETEETPQLVEENSNTSSEKEDYDNKRAELENIFMPIISRVQQANNSSDNTHENDDDNWEPSIEEVD